MQVKLILLCALFFASGKTISQVCPLPTAWSTKAYSAPTPHSEYPRPQCVRKDWLCLNGMWDYTGGKTAADAQNPEAAIGFAGKSEKIFVPFCPESYLSHIQRKQEINMWYHKMVRIPETWKGKQVLLHLEAVDHIATVFVNGQKAGRHEGGYDSFVFNITQFLTNGDNSIVIAAYDANDGRTPSGKNGPRGDYTFTSGIWQTVWMEPVGAEYIEDFRITPDVSRGGVAVSVRAAAGSKVKAVALKNNVPVATVNGSGNESFFIPIPTPVYWSPETPFLYDLQLTLQDSKGNTTDMVTSYFGLRSMELGMVNGIHRPLLNGKFEMQVGLLDQGYWPDGILTPPTDEALQYDMKMTKQAGYNLIRKHMKTENKRFYYWADKMGLLLWQDMPAIWYQDEDTAVNRSRFRKEWKAIMDDHYNSPSIIAWVPFNENWGAFDVREITDWTKAYDPSRLVNGNSGFNNNPSYQKAYGDPGNGDFVDTHIYVGPYKASVPDKNRAASLGEFGGVGLFVRGHMWPVENNAYDYATTSTTLTDRYCLLMNQVEQLMKYRGLSVAIYTQTTDVEHEVNGILTYDRKVQKMDFVRIAEANKAVIKAGRSSGH